MDIKTIIFPLLCTITVAPSAGCDLETEDSMSLESQVEEGEELPSVAIEAADELSAEPDGAAAITYVPTYTGLGKLDTLADGDIVMLRNYGEGYLGCFGGVAQLSEGPYNIDNYVWRVHEVDLDGNGEVEFQFELIDGGGFSNTYLKMSNAGTVHCGAISGIGDAAAWHEDAHSRTGGGTFYRKFHVQLENYKVGKCIQGDPNGDVVSDPCPNSTWGMAFWVEVIA